jgi:hypothetical protein
MVEAESVVRYYASLSDSGQEENLLNAKGGILVGRWGLSRGENAGWWFVGGIWGDADMVEDFASRRSNVQVFI